MQFKNYLVEASFLPMSVIIVGVGNSPFYGLESLDCHKGIMRNEQGFPAARDVV